MTNEIITQSHAARLRGVTRQAIHDLVQKHKIKTACDAEGNELSGMVYLSEVLNFTAEKNGRPRLNEAEAAARRTHNIEAGAPVIWLHKPRDGYGFILAIPAKVVRAGVKRVRLSFIHPASDNEQLAWVRPEDVTPLADLPFEGASDNGLTAQAVSVLQDIQRDAEQKLSQERSGGLVDKLS